MLKKAMIYLGLGPDEHYEDYDEAARSLAGPAASNQYPGAPGPASAANSAADPADSALGRTVRPIPIDSDRSHHAEADSAVGRAHATVVTARTAGVPGSSQPHPLSPAAFDDAKEIADRFKARQAVIVNLQGVNRDLRRRLVDFSSGLCYGLNGQMIRVANEVYLLNPPEVKAVQRQTR